MRPSLMFFAASMRGTQRSRSSNAACVSAEPVRLPLTRSLSTRKTSPDVPRVGVGWLTSGWGKRDHSLERPRARKAEPRRRRFRPEETLTRDRTGGSMSAMPSMPGPGVPRERRGSAPWSAQRAPSSQVQEPVPGVLLRRVLLVPLAREQDHRSVAAVARDERGRRRREGGALALEPGAALEGERRQRGLAAVLVAQAVLEHLELELADRRHDRVAHAGLGPEQLHRALVDELLHSLVEGLALGELPRRDAREDLGLERRQRLVLEAAGEGQRVADAEGVAVDQADDVAGVGDVDGVALLRDHRVRARESQVAVEPVVVHDEVALEPSRAHAHEGQAVAVAPIHVRLDLEDVGAEGRLDRVEQLLAAAVDVHGARARRRRELDEGVEEGLDAEVRQRRAEESRRDLALQEGLARELVAGDLKELEVVLGFADELGPEALGELGLAKREPRQVRPLRARTGGLAEEQHLARSTVDHARELARGADRPVGRPRVD